jgi:hypothetical protein
MLHEDLFSSGVFLQEKFDFKSLVRVFMFDKTVVQNKIRGPKNNAKTMIPKRGISPLQ